MIGKGFSILDQKVGDLKPSVGLYDNISHSSEESFRLCQQQDQIFETKTLKPFLHLPTSYQSLTSLPWPFGSRTIQDRIQRDRLHQSRGIKVGKDIPSSIVFKERGVGCMTVSPAQPCNWRLRNLG